MKVIVFTKSYRANWIVKTIKISKTCVLLSSSETRDTAKAVPGSRVEFGVSARSF